MKRSHDESLAVDPFKDAGLRLTYRTVRVLVAIADRPGASNRLVADTAEIKDQGQVSKLLSRLQQAGLVLNAGERDGKGTPNAWTLTERGSGLVHTIHAHTEGLGEGGAGRDDL